MEVIIVQSLLYGNLNSFILIYKQNFIGIGRVTALKLASLGAEVYGISRTAENLESLKQECPSINTICQDIGDWDATRKAVEKLPVMDGLVNNAGVNTQQAFLEVTEDKLDRYTCVMLNTLVLNNHNC